MTTYSFILEGENIDGDLITECIEFENTESSKDALELAEKEALELLKYEGGGHIDITDIDGKLLSDVEL